MTFQWAVLTILLIVIGISMDYQHQVKRVADQAELDSLSRSFLVYRSASAGFSQANPGFNGAPDDALLNLPSWFVKPIGVAVYITAGTTYTYLNSAAPSGMPSALVDLTKSGVVGIKKAGTLISPSGGATGIMLPAAIPEGAVVAIN